MFKVKHRSFWNQLDDKLAWNTRLGLIQTPEIDIDEFFVILAS